MKIKEACFACTTPYQIMGAISILINQPLEADIFIFGMFKDYLTVAKRVKQTGIFSNVYVVNPKKYRNIQKLEALIQMVNARYIVNSFFSEEISYQYYYSSSRAHIKNILLHELIRRNKSLKIIIYDDGMGTYDRSSHVLNTSKLRKTAERIIGWDMYTPGRISFSVYEPALFEKPDGLLNCPVSQMPKPDVSGQTGETIKKIFNVTQESEIREKVIIFEPLRGLDRERDEKLKTIDKCYEYAVDVFGRKNVVIKPHPLSTKVTESHTNIYRNTSIPMEALYAGMEELDHRILITYASSAVYTPKIFFDAEPWVINLFRIVDNHHGSVSEWEEPYHKFKSIYRTPSKIMAPKTIDEFEECIKGLD